MNIQECMSKAVYQLKQADIEEPVSKAKRLLAYTLQMKKIDVMIRSQEAVLPEQEKAYFAKVAELIQGKPIQYILQTQEFMKLPFYVDERVLIPQPDTEVLVEEVLSIASHLHERTIHILDVCTGSGCIGISLASYLPQALVTLTDISKQALEVASKNAEQLLPEKKIKILQSNMLENIQGTWDFIVSNPPYIATKVIPTLSQEVQQEPHLALDGGTDGLQFYRILAKQAARILKSNGYLALEIGYDQKQAVMELLQSTKQYKNILCKQDLAGNDRVILAQKGE